MGVLNLVYAVIPETLYVAVPVAILSFWFTRRILGSERVADEGRKGAAEFSEKWKKRLEYFYTRTVNLLLSWLDKLADDQYLDKPARKQGRLSSYLTPRSSGVLSPWSNGLYDLTLKLALVYPIFFLFLGWVLYGHVASGFEVMLPPGIDLWQRLLVFAGIIVFIICMRLSIHHDGWRGRAYLAVASAVAVTSPFAFAGAFAFAFAVAGAGAVAVASAVAFAVAVIMLAERFHSGRRQTVFLVLHWVFFVALAFVTINLLHHYHGDKIIKGTFYFIVFLGLLPLANAPLDWLSLGLTRGLLRFGLGTGRFFWVAFISLLDIAAAGLLMFAVAFMTTSAISLANLFAVLGGGEPVLPVLPLLHAMRDAPNDPVFYWVYLMLFSTMLPSLVHILGGFLCLLLAPIKLVFETFVNAQDLIEKAPNIDATKDSMLGVVYPAITATAVTALIISLTSVGPVWNFVKNCGSALGNGLFFTAEWTASLFLI